MSLEKYFQYDYNLAFHLEYMRLGKNDRNIEIYKNIMNYRFLAVKTSLITKEMIITAAEQHTAIVNAIKDGNIDNLKSAIRMHLDDSKLRLLDKIKENGGTI